MSKKTLLSLFFQDIFYLFLLSTLSLVLISFYFHANALNTGYADWMVHAFRIKFLQSYGLLSWTHEWDNGMNIWKSYQFFPHFLTLGLINMLHVSITRGMVLITIIQFVLLRVFIYAVLRLLHFSSVSSFISSLMSFDIAQYWGGVGDFSLLFGFTLFPIILYFWIKYYQGKYEYIFPYSIGLLFYIHPLLGLSTLALWITAILFSEKKIISFSVLVQFCIILASSSLFWFPIIVKTSYTYTASFLGTSTFLNLVLAPYTYFGLSLFLLSCSIISAFCVFMPIASRLRWTKILFVFSLMYFLFVIIGLNLNLPSILDQLQFTRGVTFIGISIIFVFAPVIERLKKIRSVALKSVLLFCFSLAVVEGVWFTSIFSPQPTKGFSEAITTYESKKTNMLSGRIWSSTIDTSSFYSPLTTQFPYSYMNHLESNQLSPRLGPLVLYQPYLDAIPSVSINRLTTYFKLSGTKYVFFEETSPFTNSLLGYTSTPYKNLGTIETSDALYHGFAVPWETRNAALISPQYQKDMHHFPFFLTLSDVNDQIALDDYVKKFSEVIYAPGNTPLTVSYPTPDTMQIAIPSPRNTNDIYINESYDADWKAYINKQAVSLSSVGPNYMLAKLTNLHESGILVLKHSWPISFYISWFFIGLIPIEILVMRSLSVLFKVKKEPSP